MNANIRRAAISITAAGALALTGNGIALADEASFEAASAGPNGPTVEDYENDHDGETANTDDDGDDEEDGEDEEDGLFFLEPGSLG